MPMRLACLWSDVAAALSKDAFDPSEPPKAQHPDGFPHDLPRADNWKNGLKTSLDNIKDIPDPMTEGFAMREYMEIERCQHKLKQLRNLTGQEELQDHYKQMIAEKTQNIRKEYATQRQELMDQLGPYHLVDAIINRALGRFNVEDDVKARWKSKKFRRELQIALDDNIFGRCWCQEDVQGPAATFCGCGLSALDEAILIVTELDDALRAGRIPLTCIRPTRINAATGGDLVKRQKTALEQPQCRCRTRTLNGQRVLICVDGINEIEGRAMMSYCDSVADPKQELAQIKFTLKVVLSDIEGKDRAFDFSKCELCRTTEKTDIYGKPLTFCHCEPVDTFIWEVEHFHCGGCLECGKIRKEHKNDKKGKKGKGKKKGGRR